MSKRYALNDAQWARIKDLLPGQAGQPGATAKNNRLFVDAVLYRYRAGIPWRDLPARFGDFRVVHMRHSRWSRTGVWQRVFEALAQDADNECRCHCIDPIQPILALHMPLLIPSPPQCSYRRTRIVKGMKTKLGFWSYWLVSAAEKLNWSGAKTSQTNVVWRTKLKSHGALSEFPFKINALQ